jgi:ergot alkaloid biosynthesis protein
MSGIVLVIGGTGKTGGRLIERLGEEGWTARCASRSAKAPPGVTGVAFDWYDAKKHDAALAGVDRIYLVAPVGSNDPIAVMEPFIERAIGRGVRRFVLLSSSLIEEGGPAMGSVHALLHRRAPEWAVLRPSWFMENFSAGQHLATIRDEDAIYSAADDGLTPFIAVDDIAEVAFRALTNEEAANDGLVLTGPVALSYDEAAAIIGAARGRAVRHVRLTGEELTARFEAFGLSHDYAVMLAGLDRAIATGAEARTTPIVARLTGRSPRSLVDFAARNASAWRPAG